MASMLVFWILTLAGGAEPGGQDNIKKSHDLMQMIQADVKKLDGVAGLSYGVHEPEVFIFVVSEEAKDQVDRILSDEIGGVAIRFKVVPSPAGVKPAPQGDGNLQRERIAAQLGRLWGVLQSEASGGSKPQFRVTVESHKERDRLDALLSDEIGGVKVELKVEPGRDLSWYCPECRKKVEENQIELVGHTPGPHGHAGPCQTQAHKGCSVPAVRRD